MRLYSKMCDEGLHQGVAVLSYAAMFMDRLRAMTPEQLKVHLDKIVDLEHRDRQTSIYRSGVDAPHGYRSVVAFEKVFQKIHKVLTDGHSWLAGNRFSLAEINLAPLARLEYMNLLDVWTGDRPRLTQWFACIKDRPSFRAEVIAWIREAEWTEIQTAGMRIRSRVTELRENYLATDPGAQIY